MDRPLRHIRTEEKGVSLPLVALSLLTLFWLSALAVDLGWFYLNAQRVQRAADAAALAGVVHLPGDLGGAVSTAGQVAERNGYVDQPGSPSDADPDYPQVLTEKRADSDTILEVTVWDEVDTFFLSVFGIDSQVISRKATAEYIPPLKLGSPENQFGNSCDPEEDDCDDQPNFWANIMGKYVQTTFGDAYSPYCDDENGDDDCDMNPTYRPRGYLYGIEKGSNSGFTVEFLDMAFHNISGGVNTGDQHRTGDRGCEQWGDSDADCGQTVTANLYAPSPSLFQLDPSDLICSHTWDPEPQVDEDEPYVWESPDSCFSVSGASAGIYRLQIVVQDPSDDEDSGLNRYSLRVDSGSQLYALGDFSIYNNAEGTTTEFFLAEVTEVYRGKTFVIELYDAGESNDPGQLQVIDPRTGAPFDDPDGECRIYSRDRHTDTWTAQGTASPCVENVAVQEYNGDWLKFEIDIPATYTCGSNCWWKMNYDYTSDLQDTTTWRAYVEGNPIHLIRNLSS